MRRELRAVVSTIVLNINGYRKDSVYDYSISKHVSVDVKLNGKHVDCYCYDGGFSVDGDIPSLYDYGSGSFFDLNINGRSFDGYDYKSGQFFDGKIENNGVSFYDYGDSKFYNFD